MVSDPLDAGAGRTGWVERLLGLFAVVLPLALHAPFASAEAIVYRADAAQLQYPRYRILCEALQVQRAFPL